MKIHPIIVACLFLATPINAQYFDWAKAFKGSSSGNGRSICVDTLGNVYTTGSFIGVVDFDPGTGITNLTSAGSSDIFVQKMDAAGNFLWAKSFGAGSHDGGRSITLDTFGNVYITGYFRGTTDFDSGPGITNLASLGGADVFVLKMDAFGNFIWAKSFGGTSDQAGYSITIDPSNNVLTTGEFTQTADFDPGIATTYLTSAGADDIFVQKMDSAGNFLWAKSFGGTYWDEGLSIKTDSWGYIYTTGYFFETVDFDPGPGTTSLTGVGGDEIFVQKLDSSGNFIWAKSFGGTSTDVGNSLIVDASGNIYTTGYFFVGADFDPGTGVTYLTPVGAEDIFIQKMDSAGNFKWAKSLGGSLSDRGQFITSDQSGNIYITGFFEGTVDFDPGAGSTNLTSLGGHDIFVQKMDSLGIFTWAKSFGGPSPGFDDGNSITVDYSGNLYTVGFFSGTVDFDPGIGISNITSAGGANIFVQKLIQCSPNTATDFITACDSYTWVNGITYTSSNNSAIDTLTNTTGCDSIVTLNLVITTLNSTTSQAGLTITANNTNATYQWLDCNNNYSMISGETNQSFTSSVNGDFAVEITENGCVDTSVCVAITSANVTEIPVSPAINVFPNPSPGELSIELNKYYHSISVILKDNLGQILSHENFYQTDKIELFISNNSGVYFIEIMAEDNLSVLKIIKI